MTDVYNRIARGDVYTVTVTIPEGANIFDVATRLEQAGIGTRQEFLDQQGRLTALIVDLDPRAKSLEGYLFPDTYRFPRKTTPAQIAAAMVHQFKKAAAEIGLKENVHDVVTLASLVERESALNSERPLIASVFENRLAKHMPSDDRPVGDLRFGGQERMARQNLPERSDARYAVQHLLSRWIASGPGGESRVYPRCAQRSIRLIRITCTL